VARCAHASGHANLPRGFDCFSFYAPGGSGAWEQMLLIEGDKSAQPSAPSMASAAADVHWNDAETIAVKKKAIPEDARRLPRQGKNS